MLYDADQSLQNAIQQDWKAATTNAQANRIENTAKEQQAAIEKAKEQAAKAISPVPAAALPSANWAKIPNINDLPQLNLDYYSSLA